MHGLFTSTDSLAVPLHVSTSRESQSLEKYATAGEVTFTSLGRQIRMRTRSLPRDGTCRLSIAIGGLRGLDSLTLDTTLINNEVRKTLFASQHLVVPRALKKGHPCGGWG